MIIAIIPAKGGSTRLPNKNMARVLGKPMLHYAIAYARACQAVSAVYVSTDSEEIADFSKKAGVEVIRRDSGLGGETPVVEVYAHALRSINNPSIKYVVGVQPDHPDRNADLDGILELIQSKNLDEIITVDKFGTVNGSLKVMKADALLHGRIGRVATIMDDCTNVHHPEDLVAAEQNLSMRQVK